MHKANVQLFVSIIGSVSVDYEERKNGMKMQVSYKKKLTKVSNSTVLYHLMHSASVSDEGSNIGDNLLTKIRLNKLRNEGEQMSTWHLQDNDCASQRTESTNDYSSQRRQFSLQEDKKLQEDLRDDSSASDVSSSSGEEDAVNWRQQLRERKHRSDNKGHYRGRKHENIIGSDTTTATKEEQVLSETLNVAILDSGCSVTVCGRVWYECYIHSLSSHDYNKIVEKPSQVEFQCEDGTVVKSKKRVLLPAYIGDTQVYLKYLAISVNECMDS